MLAFLLCGALCVAFLWPDTPSGNAVTQLLVGVHDWLLRQVSWARFIVALLVLCTIMGIVDTWGPQALQLVGATLPEVFAWFVTFDIATYIDVLALAWALATLVRVRAAMSSARSLLRKLRRVAVRAAARTRTAGRRRRPAPRRSRPRGKTGDDGKGCWPGNALPVMNYA